MYYADVNVTGSIDIGKEADRIVEAALSTPAGKDIATFLVLVFGAVLAAAAIKYLFFDDNDTREIEA